MRVDSIAGYCERCGQRFELLPPEPDARDLNLESIKSVFRYCASCHQFAGRSCCWNPEAVACIVCAPRTPAGKKAPRRRAGVTNPDRVARDALSELSAAVGALGQVAEVVEPTRMPRDGQARAAWDEAWWATSWLVARAESSRDVVSKQLWTEGRSPDDADHELKADFQRVLADYETRLRTVGARLLHSGRRVSTTTAPKQEADHRPRRPRLRSLVLPAAAAVLLIAVAAGLASGAFGNLVGSLPTAPSSTENPGLTPGGGAGGVLGGGPSTPTPTATTPPLVTVVEFDTLVMGRLAAGTGASAVVGAPEVVSFPSPFDRSVRLAGAAAEGFCLSPPGIRGGEATVALSIFLEATPGAGTLGLEATPPVGAGRMVSLSLQPLARSPLDRWYRVTTNWDADGRVDVALTDMASEATVHEERLTARAISEVRPAGSICVTLDGMGPDAGILVDNVRLEEH
jgi:hypothetical protein